MCHECRKTVEEEEKRTEVPMSALMVSAFSVLVDILLNFTTFIKEIRLCIFMTVQSGYCLYALSLSANCY